MIVLQHVKQQPVIYKGIYRMKEQAQLTVPFHGSALYIIEHNGQPYTPMKPIVEGMGLTWQPQLAKLNSNKERWGITKIVIPTLGDMQEAVCLPLRKLFAWLMSISPNKVKPEIREAVIMYQNECDDVLWEYWTKKSNKRQRAQDELNHLYFEEEISKTKGSFHGLGLLKRKLEKAVLRQMILTREQSLQLSFLPDN